MKTTQMKTKPKQNKTVFKKMPRCLPSSDVTTTISVTDFSEQYLTIKVISWAGRANPKRDINLIRPKFLKTE